MIEWQLGRKMTSTQIKYMEQLRRQLTLVCSDTMGALVDSHMFMFPAAIEHNNYKTHIFLYSFYAIRQHTVLSTRKLVELSGKDKINVHSIVMLVTKPEFPWLSDNEKKALIVDWDNLFHSEHNQRIKDFRNALCHNIPDRNEVKCYFEDFMYIIEGAIYILSQLYQIAFDKIPAFFKEARDIAMTLSKEYWKAVDKATDTSNNHHEINIRLDQLLNGKF